MIEYQNIFTRVQVHGPADMGVPMKPGNWPRNPETATVRLLGFLGDAQIGPIYLGFLGIASL
ncbi:MAG: photosynthetic reaction center subunit M, partial [Hyphomicrobiales bacterium]